MNNRPTLRVLSILATAPALALVLTAGATALTHGLGPCEGRCSLAVSQASSLDLIYCLDGETLPAAPARAAATSLEVGTAGVMDLTFTLATATR